LYFVLNSGHPVFSAQDNCAPTIARRQLRADNCKRPPTNAADNSAQLIPTIAKLR